MFFIAHQQASIYHATYAVHRVHKNEVVWVLLFNAFQSCLTGILTWHLA